MTLKKQTYSGLIWTFVDTFLVRGLSFIAMIFLARWIGPTEFGLIGMIAVFIAVGTTLTDSGMSHSLIRTKKTDSKDFSTVFFVNLIMSLLVYLIVYLSAPIIASFFKQEVLVSIIRVYSLIFIIIAFSAVQLAILNKDMAFRKITKINFPSTLIGVSIGLYLGYNDYGVWSVVWMYLITALAKTVFLWFSSNWKPQLIFSKEKFDIHFKFGYKLALSGLLNTLFNNIYNILIGKYFSAQTLGFYERAKQFSEYPSSTLTGILAKVTYPMLSQIQDDPIRLEMIYRKLIRVSFFIIAPLMLGAAAIAEPLFLVLLGEEWLPAVPFFQILSLAMMLYPIHAFNINILKVYGRSDLFLRLEIIKKIIITLSILISFQFGVMGLVWSSVLASFAALAINMFYSSKLINYPILIQFRDLIYTILIALSMAIFMFFIIYLLPKNFLITQLIIASICGTLFYLGINYFVKNSPLHQALSLLKNKSL